MFVNEQIRAKEVMVIGPNGEQLGVKPIKDALTLANYAGFDLVLINQNANPQVCKIMDYNKFKYENKKRQSVIKYNTGHKLLYNFLNTNFKDVFNEITYFINYHNGLIEYYLYYTGQKWSNQHIRELTYKISQDLYAYAQEYDLIKEYEQCTIIITKKRS